MWQEISELKATYGAYLGWAQESGGPYFFYIGEHNGERRFYDLDAIDSGNIIRVYPSHFMDYYPLPNGKTR